MSEWMKDWKKVVIAAGAVAAGGAAVCYLLRKHPQVSRQSNTQVPVETTTPVPLKPNVEDISLKDDPEVSRQPQTGAPVATIPLVTSKSNVEDIGKETCQRILEEIITAQNQMKMGLKEVTNEVLEKQMNFEQTYQRIREVQPKDPLKEYGLSMGQFDQILNKYQGDHKIRESIARIMGKPDVISEKAKSITVHEIIETQQFMQEELSKLVDYVLNMPEKDDLDMKIVTIAAQAIAVPKLEKKFSIKSEDIESAIHFSVEKLQTNQTFIEVNMQLQTTMSKLMGCDLASL
jgi:hypothetical protein